MSADLARTGTATHRFRVARDADDPNVWLAEWVQDNRVHTHGRSLVEVENHARDALALWLQLDPNQVAVQIAVDLPDGLAEDLERLHRLGDGPQLVPTAVRDQQRSVARRLVDDAGMTSHDAAHLLGVSHQRVAQLLDRGA